MVRLAASPNTSDCCMFWHTLKSCISTFSHSKGCEQISFGSWQQGACRRRGKEVGGQGHSGSLVASRTSAPAVNNPLSPPTYPTDVSLSLSCPQAIPVNDLCIATESPMWQLNLFTAQNCWCAHGSPVIVLHACKNRNGAWEGLSRRNWGKGLEREARVREDSEMSRLPHFASGIKRNCTLRIPLFGLLALLVWCSFLLLW